MFLGGVAGTLVRAGLVEAWPPQAGHWPWVTFVVNVAGSALLGWVVAGQRHHRLLGVGLCGALTTFSTFQLELVHMADAGRPLLAVAYAGTSLAVGLAAVGLAGRRHAA